MTKEEIKDFCDMKVQLEPENKDIYKTIVKALEQEPVLDKIRAEIDKARFIDKDTRIVKNALASGLEVAMQIIDKYANDRCDKGCDFCEHTSECMPSKEEEGLE